MRVGNTRRQRTGIGSLVGTHHAHNAHVDTVGNLGCHKVGVARHIGPHTGLFVFAIRIGRRQHLKRRRQRIVVGKVGGGLGRFDLAIGRHGAVDQVVELIDIQRADAIERIVAHRATARKHHHGLVGRRRPMTGDDVVLAVEQALVVNHLVEDRGPHGLHAHRCRRARASAHSLGHRVGHQAHGLLVALARAIHDRRHAVAVLNGVDLFVDAVAAIVEPRLKARHIVGLNARKHILYGRDHGNLIGLLSRTVRTGGGAARSPVILRGLLPTHHGRQVVILLGDGERIARERILLDLFDVVVHAVGERQNRRDADNTDRARECRHSRTALLGHEVACRKPQRRHKAHRGFARGLGFATRSPSGVEGVGIVGDLSICEIDDARGVLVRQLGVVRDHDDQAVARNLLEQVHDLHGRRRVQGAGRLVCQHDLGVVNQGTGNGHALHLSARKLARTLVHMLAQTNCLKRLARTLATLGMANARERERQLHVFQNGLMRNKVIALEHKADAVVAVGVPIAVAEVLGRNTVDEQIARVKMIQSADDVEHRSFARTRRAQNGHELVVSKGQAHVIERHLRKRLRDVPFANIFELQHGRQPLPRGYTRPLSPAVRIRRVCPTLFRFLVHTSEKRHEPRQNERDDTPHSAPSRTQH